MTIDGVLTPGEQMEFVQLIQQDLRWLDKGGISNIITNLLLEKITDYQALVAIDNGIHKAITERLDSGQRDSLLGRSPPPLLLVVNRHYPWPKDYKTITDHSPDHRSAYSSIAQINIMTR